MKKTTGKKLKDGQARLATMQGKEFALKELAARRKISAGRKQIDNGALPAGAPMYFYCISCGLLADTLPENYCISTPKKLCDECQALKDIGWLNE